ncbi:two-component system, OmpR family, sensor histidine kinase ResE [Jeotgalicoccus aerolatus]|uniref:histidine kinase n=1 Tax=Jeotgalicoccus aerolatus TaxID=709510 RepID=A0A1G8UYJ2_9STAP|nr:ATP-binding protein [Jeotgalicoccus aerolatus]SDJ58010.1 two-component system, OmpR family, sensor histidine kinase ResE [Jeotgalicoccus aerolatus]
MSFFSSVVTKLWFTILMIVTTVLIIFSLILSFYFRNYALSTTEDQLETELSRIENVVLSNHTLDLNDAYLAAEENLIIYSDGTFIAGDNEIAEEIYNEMISENLASSTFIVNDINEREFMVKVSDLSEYFESDTAIIKYDNLDRVNQSYMTVLIILIISAAVLFLITTFFAFFLISRITKPLIALKNASFKTAGGKYNQLKVTSRDEIGELTLAFNKMNDNIKNTISELTHEKNLRETVFSSLSNGIIYFNTSAELVYSNDKGRWYFEQFQQNEEAFRQFKDMLKDISKTDEPHLESLDMNDQHLQVAMSPVKSSEEENGVTVLIRDITDEYNTEKMRTDFISSVSHELKTPMVMLSGYSEALLDDIVTEPDEVKEMVSIIKDESDRMNKLVNELLIIARMDSDEVLYDITPQDFNILLEELHQRFSFEMRDNELTLEINIPADTVVFPFDYDKLNQVFTNLIDNAIRYTKAGGVITINVSREDDGYITVEVKDTGTGIKRENLKHIFERFYKADEARTRGKHGTGLGLYIVSNIITNHDGTITADSLVGEGTTFTIKLPENRKE